MEPNLKASTKQKRSRLEIYADILGAIKTESSPDGAVVTRVQYQTRAPFVRFKKYLEVMQSLNLIRLLNGRIIITQAGEDLLSDYERIKTVLERGH